MDKGMMGLAHQEEGESSKADTSSSKQRCLHGRVLTHLSGIEGEFAEPFLQEKTKREGNVKSLKLFVY